MCCFECVLLLPSAVIIVFIAVVVDATVCAVLQYYGVTMRNSRSTVPVEQLHISNDECCSLKHKLSFYLEKANSVPCQFIILFN